RFLVIKGLTQKNPVSFSTPLYLPKNIITTASLGSSFVNPNRNTNQNKNNIILAINTQIPSKNSQTTDANITISIKIIKIPLVLNPLKLNSFVSIKYSI